MSKEKIIVSIVKIIVDSSDGSHHEMTTGMPKAVSDKILIDATLWDDEWTASFSTHKEYEEESEKFYKEIKKSKKIKLMNTADMDAKQIANALVESFKQHVFYDAADNAISRKQERHENAKACAFICVNTYLSDLKESMDVAKELHPHAKGLVAGSIVSWTEVKKEIEKL